MGSNPATPTVKYQVRGLIHRVDQAPDRFLEIVALRRERRRTAVAAWRRKGQPRAWAHTTPPSSAPPHRMRSDRTPFSCLPPRSEKTGCVRGNRNPPPDHQAIVVEPAAPRHAQGRSGRWEAGRTGRSGCQAPLQRRAPQGETPRPRTHRARRATRDRPPSGGRRWGGGEDGATTAMLIDTLFFLTTAAGRWHAKRRHARRPKPPARPPHHLLVDRASSNAEEALSTAWSSSGLRTGPCTPASRWRSSSAPRRSPYRCRCCATGCPRCRGRPGPPCRHR